MDGTPTREATLGRDLGGWIKLVLLGRALASHKAEHQLLPKVLALPVFSSDPLSSVAYATEEMMLGPGRRRAPRRSPLMLPIGLASPRCWSWSITSYRQTVRAYPEGGGSYIVARENLGRDPRAHRRGGDPDRLRADGRGERDRRVDRRHVGGAGLADLRVPMAIGFIVLITLREPAGRQGGREASSRSPPTGSSSWSG